MINLIQGNSADFDIDVTLDGSVYDLTNHVVWFTVKTDSQQPDAEAVLQATTEDNIDIYDGPNGKVRVSLTPEQTNALPLDVILRCDIQIMTPEGKIYTLLFEEIVMTPRITHALIAP